MCETSVLNLGDPISPRQNVDVVEHFSWDELQALLMRAAIDRQIGNGDWWSGHVKISTSTEPMGVTATISLWKIDPPDNGQKIQDASFARLGRVEIKELSNGAAGG